MDVGLVGIELLEALVPFQGRPALKRGGIVELEIDQLDLDIDSYAGSEERREDENEKSGAHC